MIETGILNDEDKVELLEGYNLPDQQIEVYTNPSGPGAAASYGQRHDYRAGDLVPVVLDGVQVGQIVVSEILG